LIHMKDRFVDVISLNSQYAARCENAQIALSKPSGPNSCSNDSEP
jgi:hypothetical protein